MISLEESLAQLVQHGGDHVEEARMRASHPEAFESFRPRLGRFQVS